MKFKNLDKNYKTIRLTKKIAVGTKFEDMDFIDNVELKWSDQGIPCVACELRTFP